MKRIKGIVDGLHAAGRDAGRLDRIGIDTWAVDRVHGVLRASVAVSLALAYPSHRTRGAPAAGRP